jgi:hypothetical protein
MRPRIALGLAATMALAAPGMLDRAKPELPTDDTERKEAREVAQREYQSRMECERIVNRGSGGGIQRAREREAREAETRAALYAKHQKEDPQ